MRTVSLVIAMGFSTSAWAAPTSGLFCDLTKSEDGIATSLWVVDENNNKEDPRYTADSGIMITWGVMDLVAYERIEGEEAGEGQFVYSLPAESKFTGIESVEFDVAEKVAKFNVTGEDAVVASCEYYIDVWNIPAK